MRKLLLTYFLLLCAGGYIHGREDDLPGLTYGVEWGYMPALYSAHHYNFFDPYNYFRVYGRDAGMTYCTNAEVNMHIGYNLNRYWNLSFRAGYAGAAEFTPVIPLTLRATRLLGDNHLIDRWFTFGEIGSGIIIKERPEEIWTVKAGGGYRVSLSRNTKMDFIAAIRFLYMHPEIIHYDAPILSEYINRNDGYVGSLFLGISLTF
jgi:hypothetical protein